MTHGGNPHGTPGPGVGPQDAAGVFEILVREHADMLEAYLRSLLGRGADIDDLFQETMIVAWRRLGDYDRARPFGAWLRGIARVLVLKHAREGAARPMTTNPLVLDAVEDRFDAHARLPGDTFLERTERLLDCLRRLPEAMHQAIDLVYTRGMTIVAAASSIGDPEETVKKRVQRARQRLAECLGAGAR